MGKKMHSEENKFSVQHTDKCYCAKSCICNDIESVSKYQTNNLFSKIRNRYGDSSTEADTISSFLELSSSKVHVNSRHCSCDEMLPLYFTNKDKTNNTENINFSERRLNYERLKEFKNELLYTTSLQFKKQSIFGTSDNYNSNEDGCFDIDQIDEICRFRVENAAECFSPITSYSIVSKFKKNKEYENGHCTCEFLYHLYNTGLHKFIDIDENRKLVCIDCDKKYKICRNAIIPPVPPTTTATLLTPHITLNIKNGACCDINVAKRNKNFNIRYFPIHSDKSLALRYQKRT